MYYHSSKTHEDRDGFIHDEGDMAGYEIYYTFDP